MKEEPYYRLDDWHWLTYFCMAFSRRFRWQMRSYEECRKKAIQYKKDLEELTQNPDSEESKRIRLQHKDYMAEFLKSARQTSLP